MEAPRETTIIATKVNLKPLAKRRERLAAFTKLVAWCRRGFTNVSPSNFGLTMVRLAPCETASTTNGAQRCKPFKLVKTNWIRCSAGGEGTVANTRWDSLAGCAATVKMKEFA